MTVASVHHLHVVIGDSRKRLSAANRGCEQNREGDKHSEERSEVQTRRERAHRPVRSTSRRVAGSNG